jgi:hypothetical protein
LREAAGYADRILRLEQSSAKALGLTVPPSMFDLADEVIE